MDSRGGPGPATGTPPAAGAPGAAATGWGGRRRALIAVGAVVLAALAYLAGSGGWSGVFGGDDGPVEVRWEDAATVAVDESDGVVARVLVAATDVGPCVGVGLADQRRVRYSDARCGEPLLPWDDPDFQIVRLDDYFGTFGQFPLQRTDGSWRVALAGSVHPAVARVTVHFGDDRQYSFVTRNDGGWFVTLVPVEIADPDVALGYLVNPPVRLELFDADGTRVASVDLTTVIGRAGGAV